MCFASRWLAEQLVCMLWNDSFGMAMASGRSPRANRAFITTMAWPPGIFIPAPIHGMTGRCTHRTWLNPAAESKQASLQHDHRRATKGGREETSHGSQVLSNSIIFSCMPYTSLSCCRSLNWVAFHPGLTAYNTTRLLVFYFQNP